MLRIVAKPQSCFKLLFFFKSSNFKLQTNFKHKTQPPTTNTSNHTIKTAHLTSSLEKKLCTTKSNVLDNHIGPCPVPCFPCRKTNESFHMLATSGVLPVLHLCTCSTNRCRNDERSCCTFHDDDAFTQRFGHVATCSQYVQYYSTTSSSERRTSFELSSRTVFRPSKPGSMQIMLTRTCVDPVHSNKRCGL